MAISIVVSDTVGIKVKGTLVDSAGITQPFDFRLTCTRLDSDQISAKLKNDPESSITDFLIDVVQDWSGVRDADGKPVPYSESALQQLCKLQGVAMLALRAYLSDVGAKEKN